MRQWQMDVWKQETLKRWFLEQQEQESISHDCSIHPLSAVAHRVLKTKYGSVEVKREVKKVFE